MDAIFLVTAIFYGYTIFISVEYWCRMSARKGRQLMHAEIYNIETELQKSAGCRKQYTILSF